MKRGKQSNESVRYTDEGITVVALDRRGRGLHRARPERHFPSSRHPVVPPRRGLAPVVLAVVLAVAAVAWLLTTGE